MENEKDASGSEAGLEETRRSSRRPVPAPTSIVAENQESSGEDEAASGDDSDDAPEFHPPEKEIEEEPLVFQGEVFFLSL